MPRYVIDTDELAKVLLELPSAARSSAVMNSLRGMHTKESIPVWAKPEKVAPRARKALPSKQSDEFKAFYKAYPRKSGPKAAWKAWWKACTDFSSQEDLLIACLDALDWQVSQDQWVKDNGDYIPHASTWLNAGRWEDEDPHHGAEMEEYMNENGELKTRRKGS